LGQVARRAAQAGLEYDVDRVSPANTRKAHQALHFAKDRGLQLPLLDRLFRAYFAEGRAIGRDEVVADLAADVGLDHDEVLSVLRSGELAGSVRGDIERARGYGITGVPFYLVDGVYGLTGVQEPATFTALLERARAEKAEPA
jgi:predicted DsbA family dithiol-disulfide isomerase